MAIQYSAVHIFGCPTGRQIFWAECFIVFQLIVKIPFPSLRLAFTLVSVLDLVCMYVRFGLFLLILLSTIICNKPITCNSVSIVFISNYQYALHVSDVLCVYHQDHYKL